MKHTVMPSVPACSDWRAALSAIALGFGALFADAAPAFATEDGASAATQIATESYKLPISAPLDQGDSDLCWVYATLSMLETNYLTKHPSSKIQLSRGALQRVSIADRLRRRVAGDSDHLEDGGIAVDALRLIRQHGLVADRDFHGIVDPDPIYATVSQRVSKVSGDKLKALDAELASRLGVAPRQTALDGTKLTPEQLAQAVLGNEVWSEFDISPSIAGRSGPSTDPDARPETQVHYVDLPTAIDLIHRSLKRGQAVVWGSTDNHALLIYGADYDAEGKPLAYWVKDSLPARAYKAPAQDIHRVLTDVTVAEPPLTEVRAAQE